MHAHPHTMNGRAACVQIWCTLCANKKTFTLQTPAGPSSEGVFTHWHRWTSSTCFKNAAQDSNHLCTSAFFTAAQYFPQETLSHSGGTQPTKSGHPVTPELNTKTFRLQLALPLVPLHFQIF